MNASDIKSHCARALAYNKSPEILRLYAAAHDIFSQLEQLEGPATAVPAAFDMSEYASMQDEMQRMQDVLDDITKWIRRPWWKRLMFWNN
jgi:hypothetical protein